MSTLHPPPARLASGTRSSRWHDPRGLLLATGAASVLLWYLPGAGIILYPLRIFVTFVHEGGHAFATVLTGGSVDSIAVWPTGSGRTLSLGGSPFIVLMAGYLGTALAGAACLLVARKRGAGRGGLVCLAACTLLVTGLWVHPWPHPFGFAMGLLAGLSLAAAARLLPDRGADVLLAFLAVQLGLNALLDVRDLLFLTANTGLPNDARFMADRFGGMPLLGTPLFWAAAWAIGATAILAAALRLYWRRG